MEATAVDSMVMAEMEERLGREAFVKLVQETAPAKVNKAKLALRVAFVVSVLFWLGFSENLVEIEAEIPAEFAYPMAVVHLLAMKKWLMTV
jgi:hypothetical protein